MTLSISKVAERLAQKHGLELTATDDHVAARFIGSGATFTGGSAQAAIDQALLSLTEGGSAQGNGQRATEKSVQEAAQEVGEAVERAAGGLVPIEQADDPNVDAPARKKRAKAKKPPRKAKAKKVKAPKRAKRQREDGDEDEEGSDDGNSVVRAKYRKLYKPTKNTCGDPFVEAFEEATRDKDGKKVVIDKLVRVGKANKVDVLGRWGHLKGRDGEINVGMLRMNLGNVLRALVRNGTAVKIGEQTFEPEGE